MPVIGCCNSPPNLVVISQYIPIGSLFQVLHEQVGNTQSQAVVIDTTTALQFAHDVAKGMAFLHSLDRQMPRFHLNSKHVMVRNNLRQFWNLNHHCNKIKQIFEEKNMCKNDPCNSLQKMELPVNFLLILLMSELMNVTLGSSFLRFLKIESSYMNKSNVLSLLKLL